jgi:hypothetical protein
MIPVPLTSQTLTRSLLRPAGNMSLVYGDSLVFRLSMVTAAELLASGGTIAVVDGCNRFDLHAITKYARERKLDPHPLLDRVFVSRGFTCYQMEAAVTAKLPEFLLRHNGQTAMIFGLLDTFYDEQVSLQEVQHILQRVLRALDEMKQRNISILLACTEWNVHPKERNMLFDHLKNGMDRVYRLVRDEAEQPKLFLEDHYPVQLQKSA